MNRAIRRIRSLRLEINAVVTSDRPEAIRILMVRELEAQIALETARA